MIRTRGRRSASLWLIALLATLPHLAALGGEFVYDDFRFVRDNPGVRSLSRPLEFLTQPGRASQPADPDIYRPLRTLGFALQQLAFGGRASGFHAVSLLLHLFVVRALLSLLLALAPDRPWAAALAALWFGVHPLTVECVAWISSQGDLWAALFVLLSLRAALWVACPDSEASSARPRDPLPPGRHRALVPFVLAVTTAAIALLGKESAIPLSAVAFVVLRQPRRSLIGGSRWKPALPFVLAALTLCYLAWRQHVLERGFGAGPDGFAQSTSSQVSPLLRAGQNWTVLLRMFAMPIDLSIDYGDGYLPVPGMRHLAIAVISLWVGFWVACRRRDACSLACTGLCAAVLFFLPTSGLIEMKNPTAERFHYLPCIGLSMFFATLSSTPLSTPIARGARSVLLVLLLLSLASRTVLRSLDFRDQGTLFAAEREVHPRSTQAILALGELAWQRGDRDKAVSEFSRVVELLPEGNPRRIGALYNLGLLAEESGESEIASKFWQTACAEARSTRASRLAWPLLWLKLGGAVRRRGDVVGAEALAREGLAAFGESEELLELLGVCRDQQDHPSEAVDLYRRALDLGGDSAVLHYHLGLALHHLGRDAEAVEELVAALTIDPGLASARNLLAELRH